jgi:hypothetical protein
LCGPCPDKTSCSVEGGPIDLRYKVWSWPNAFRLSPECRLREGWSGSGIVSNSASAIGILSGGNEAGSCLDDYCESRSDGDLIAMKDSAYFMPISFLKNCTDSTGRIHPKLCFPILKK